MTKPSLTNLGNATFAENTVNAAAQIIDSDVTFTDPDDDFDGGTLVVSGLLAEDTVSIASGLVISLSGGVVYYDADGAGAGAAIAIGTAAGGVGGTFTVTFNASATAAMVDLVFQNLSYANASDTPTASRTLLINVTDAAGGDLGMSGAPVFANQTGASNPWNGFVPGGRSTPALADLDNDGDLDLLVGIGSGTMAYFENTGTAQAPVYVQRTGAANPTNGIDVGSNANPAFVDVDGDGDQDLLVGESAGGFAFFRNTGTATAPVFVQQTGASNPFNGLSVSLYSSPSFGDLDGDGDIDLVVGVENGTVAYFLNTGTNIAPAYVQQAGAANPFNAITAPIWHYNWATPSLLDLDLDGDLDLFVGGTLGRFRYFENTGSSVTPVFVERTGSSNPLDAFQANFGSRPAGGDIDGDGDLDLITGDANSGVVTYYQNTVPHGQSITVSVTAQNDLHSLTGLATSVTFGENLVNATPQILDVDVTFTDPDAGYAGGTLTVSGLLAEDRLSVNNQGGGAGQIGLSGADVQYGGVTVGTLAGGVGGTFTITFNASATAAAVELLIESLTYANSSDTPTASRTLTLNITDAAGGDLSGDLTYTSRTGAANPFDGFDVGSNSRPVLVDLDGDGDLDAVVGEDDGFLNYFENMGTASAPVFIQRTGAANPFDGVDVSYDSHPTFADLDNDGDLDALVGDFYGFLHYFENTGTSLAPVFIERTGAANPFDGVDVGLIATPAFIDLDGDGDLDAVIGENDGILNYYENTGTNLTPVFTQRTGAANPFDGVDIGANSAPTFADVDDDGDLDAVVGEGGGPLKFFENTGTAMAPVFVERTGAANPFSGASSGATSAPALGDVDGDGDLDLLVGYNAGLFVHFENTTSRGPTITVGVTAQGETITGTAAGEAVSGGAQDDYLDGGDGDDTLTGGADNDYLKGGTGADAMSGGLGDDTYIVDNIGDVTDETGGDGTDLIRSSISWTLGADLENLDLLSGGVAINGTGNELGNVITGNSYANTLWGLGGDDTLYGGGGIDSLYGDDGTDSLDGGTGDDFLDGGDGDDTLVGGAGHDYLRGGDGADHMLGGVGNDYYVVDDIGDTPDESGGGGTDTVHSRISWTLGAGLENLVLGGGGGDTDGTGNGLRNTLTGNAGRNILSGGDEVDTLYGGGNDDILHGDAGNDVLYGENGRDRLYGGAGGDKLTGGAMADGFIFTDLDIRRSSLGQTADKDQILDLGFGGGDYIDLSAIDANLNLGGDQAFAFVSKFSRSAGEAVLSYSASTGKTTLQLDVDGDGKADLRVEINGDVTGTTANLYTGAMDHNGGWVL